MSDVHVVVLGAGKGTRMKSAHAKVLHRIAGRPMIDYVIAAAGTLNPATTTVVVGHQAEQVKSSFSTHRSLTFVVQEPQLGTAHALLTVEPVLRHRNGIVVLLSGDVPLLRPATLELLVETHRRAGAAATVLTTSLEHPSGYGRIVRNGEQIARIVEDKDATPTEREIREVNAGIYAFALDGLFDSIRTITPENAQREYYLPDLVSVFRKRDLPVVTAACRDAREILGVNSRQELAAVSKLVMQTKNSELMAAGVTIEDPETAYIEPDVQVGSDTIIRPGVSLERGTVVGSGCTIYSGVRITNSRLGDRVTVLDHSVIVDSDIANDASVGPFAHLRMQTTLAAGARVGNFVEVKKTVLGPGSKAMHLSYLGDAVLGREVNVGAGTITCNYDGTHKHTTTIEDRAFIGSDTQLIAPVTVGEGAYVGTGTTVRENVPSGALAVSAGKQRNLEGWVAERKKKQAR